MIPTGFNQILESFENVDPDDLIRSQFMIYARYDNAGMSICELKDFTGTWETVKGLDTLNGSHNDIPRVVKDEYSKTGETVYFSCIVTEHPYLGGDEYGYSGGYYFELSDTEIIEDKAPF